MLQKKYKLLPTLMLTLLFILGAAPKQTLHNFDEQIISMAKIDCVYSSFAHFGYKNPKDGVLYLCRILTSDGKPIAIEQYLSSWQHTRNQTILNFAKLAKVPKGYQSGYIVPKKSSMLPFTTTLTLTDKSANEHQLELKSIPLDPYIFNSLRQGSLSLAK